MIKHTHTHTLSLANTTLVSKGRSKGYKNAGRESGDQAYKKPEGSSKDLTYGAQVEGDQRRREKR